MQFDASFCAEVFQVLRIALVGDVLHPYMHSAHLDAGTVNPLSSGHEFGQQQRVFTARQGNQYMVAIVQQLIVYRGLVEASLDTVLYG